MINTLLEQFGIQEKITNLRIGRSYFQNPDAQLLNKQPVYSGKCIAHERGDKLIPSIDFLEWIAKRAQQKVVVSEKGEWLFICGKNILSPNITSHTSPPANSTVIVLNKHNEPIGYGRTTKELTEKKAVIQRIFDIGDLLRRERR